MGQWQHADQRIGPVRQTWKVSRLKPQIASLATPTRPQHMQHMVEVSQPSDDQGCQHHRHPAKTVLSLTSSPQPDHAAATAR